MGGKQSKVADKAFKAAINRNSEITKPTTPKLDDLTLASGRAQLDPEVLKEISKWSTVKVNISIIMLLSKHFTTFHFTSHNLIFSLHYSDLDS
jgi:hypothetical protein